MRENQHHGAVPVCCKNSSEREVSAEVVCGDVELLHMGTHDHGALGSGKPGMSPRRAVVGPAFARGCGEGWNGGFS